jgi:hypothetical protein
VPDHYADGSGTQSREDLAYVCDQLGSIRAALEAHSPEGAASLERLLAALRDGADLAAPLNVLHEALLAAGDAAGIHARARGLHAQGANAATPEEWVLLCPTGQCSRYAWPDGPDTPRCRISDQPLREERL